VKKKIIPFVLGLLHQLFLLVLDSVFLVLCKKRGRQDESLRQKILIVRFDAIGDFFLWLGSVRALRKVYPYEDYEITLLGNSLWADLARDLGVFDSVWSLDRKSFFGNPLYRLSMLKKVRRTAFEVAAQPVYSREFSYGDSLIRATGALERIGFQGDVTNTSICAKKISDRWYTKLLKVRDDEVMELQRQAEFIRGLGHIEVEPSFPCLGVCYPLPEEFAVERYCVVVPGAGATHRQWPLENFAKVAKLIHDRFGLRVVICGAPSEAVLGSLLAESLPEAFCNWVGRTSLRELIAIVDGSRFVLSNETSAVHIAAAVGVPSVCIQGGGHFGRFVPYQITASCFDVPPVSVNAHMDCFKCNWVCRFDVPTGEPAPCIEKITVESVWNAVEKVMQRA